MKKFALVAGGIFFILLGVVGWLVPVMPGWLFIFAGLSMIAPAMARRLRRRFLGRFFKEPGVFLKRWGSKAVAAGFTTRHFPAVFHRTADLLEPSNQKKFTESFAAWRDRHGWRIPARRFIFLEQVHANRIEILENAGAVPESGFLRLPQADGVITCLKELTLLVMTADCLSVFLDADTGPSSPEWIGIVHAGWRGTQKGISKKAFELICARSGCPASKIRVAFGPSIGSRDYEVGPEFRGIFHHSVLKERAGRLFFDLAAENRRQLIEAGANPANLEDTGISTIEDNADFYSFRKEKEAAGRIISFIGLVG